MKAGDEIAMPLEIEIVLIGILTDRQTLWHRGNRYVLHGDQKKG